MHARDIRSQHRAALGNLAATLPCLHSARFVAPPAAFPEMFLRKHAQEETLILGTQLHAADLFETEMVNCVRQGLVSSLSTPIVISSILRFSKADDPNQRSQETHPTTL